MSLIIETIDDFIRALRGNEEFKAAARRELLTQDLLELPKEFREFKTSTEERFDGIDQRFDRVEGDIRTLTASVNDLRGSALEGKLPTRLRQRAGRTLRLTRPRILWLAEHYVQPPSRAEEFARSLEQATDNGQITEEEADRLFNTDMIMRAANAAGESTHIAVEASGVIGSSDISRARESADILKKMYDEDAVAAVYGFSIEERQVQQAKATDDLDEVHVFLETEGL